MSAIKIKKSKSVLTNAVYDTHKTSLLTFHFEPEIYESRLQDCSLQHTTIEGKEIYLIDGFFQESEARELRNFSKTTSFSRNSYGSSEAIERGEKPALSMDNKERWLFFSKPPSPIQEIYKLLATISSKIDVDISTLPWELSDLKTGSPSVIANFLEEASLDSMELGKHQDSNPEQGIAFGIPILYSENQELHKSRFVNGDVGKPWLVTLMLYVTCENFLPEYKMGTMFYQSEGKPAFSANCQNGRMVLFESDLFHSIEQSMIPKKTKTWRVSYVYKLCFNPRKKNQSIKADLRKLLISHQETDQSYR